MAAVNVTISGVLCDKYGRTITPVTLVGEMVYTGLGVGGGPIIPPDKPPIDPGLHPEHPIMLPGMPGWGDPHPEHPIVIPKPPEGFPNPPDPPSAKPPPPEGGWGWHPEYGWGYFPGGGGKPRPPGGVQPPA